MVENLDNIFNVGNNNSLLPCYEESQKLNLFSRKKSDII